MLIKRVQCKQLGEIMNWQNMTRNDLITALTKAELEWFLETPHGINEMVQFIKQGCYDQYDTEKLKQIYVKRFGDNEGETK